MTVREEWLSRLLQIVSPVLTSLEKRELKKNLPLGFHAERAEFAPLEAFGRSMLGLAPWLEADPESLSGEEHALQETWRERVLACLDAASDPASPDFMVFDRGGQPLVDTAFLAHALLRAPGLANRLSSRVRAHLADAFRSSRSIIPGPTNWLFFSAMTEAGLRLLGEEADLLRVISALRAFRGWYKGDGVYGDGEAFHWDYYNSFVIQPMYVDLVRFFEKDHPEIAAMKEEVCARASRHASQLERMIGPDGTYPVIGRSVCYRFGVFQMLAQAALEHMLEKELSPAAVRCGLTAVIRRVMDSAQMTDEAGFLLPGIIGRQEELAEAYINIGSLYLCTAAFLPLGLAPQDPFWADEDAAWTGKLIWEGRPSRIDHALD